MSDLRKAFEEYMLCRDDAVWAGNNEEKAAKELEKIEKKWLAFENLLRDSISKA